MNKCRKAFIAITLVITGITIPGAEGEQNLWDLAQDNRSIHRFSTSIKAQEMKAIFTNDESIDKAVAWYKQHGFTKVYLETFRFGYLVERPLLEKTINRFRNAGIETGGLVTPTMIGKISSGWNVACCYSDLPTQKRTRKIFEYTASFFDTILIDDFWFTDCTCEICSKAMKAQTVTIGEKIYPVGKPDWSHYRRELMCRLAEENVIKACRAVNPKVRVIVKFPCWYDGYQDKGYDVPPGLALKHAIIKVHGAVHHRWRLSSFLAGLRLSAWANAREDGMTLWEQLPPRTWNKQG